MANAGRPVTQRQLRVGEMIKQSLSMIFLKDEAKIPSINTKEITVTEVRMSPDLKTAKVFVLPLGGKNSDEIIGKLTGNLVNSGQKSTPVICIFHHKPRSIFTMLSFFQLISKKGFFGSNFA